MALPKFIGVERDAKVSAMDQDLDTLEKIVQLYNSDKGEYPLKATKVTISDQTLKDTLSKINDDSSEVYEIDIDKIKPYLERLKFNDSTADTYLYSTKTGTAINKQGKMDSNNNIHYILNTNVNLNDSIKPLKFYLPVGSVSSNDFFIINIDNNNLYGSGDNGHAQLGDGTSGGSKLTPINISSINGIKFRKIASSIDHTLAIGDDGELYSWGYNGFGQIGNNTIGSGGNIYSSVTTPQKITLESGVKPTQIAVGDSFSMAIGDDGNLYSWGYNEYGKLGDGTTIERHIPTKVTLASGVKPTQIACGIRHSMAIGDDGKLYTWGVNWNGELGDGTSGGGNFKKTPIEITLESGVKVIQISCGVESSMAIGDNGELYTWGRNDYGQLGNGTIGYYTSKSSPTKIILASGVKPKQIACGGSHTMAIGDNGELYTWGLNSYGQLGNNTTIDAPTPIKITLASGIKPKQIACGYNHSMVIDDEDNVYTWGRNGGALGNSSPSNEIIPTKVEYDFK